MASRQTKQTFYGPFSTRFRTLGTALSIALTVVALTRVAAANKKAECAAAYEQSQELRASAKLHAARESLVICAQGACPSFIQSDCTQWLAELQREMPTVVVAAKNRQGTDASGVKVTIDGEGVEAEHEGSAIAVDPGRHTFRFEIEGAPPIEREVVIRQGEKDRILDVAFDTAGESASAPAAPATLPPPEDKLPEEKPVGAKPGPLRPYAYVAGGVGAAGIIAFAAFGLAGKGQESDIEGSGCKPNCSPGDVDSVRTKYILADVSLGIGLAGLGAGVALFFLSQPQASHSEHAALPLTFDVKTTRGGGYATVGRTF
jgi:hypothetical protein